MITFLAYLIPVFLILVGLTSRRSYFITGLFFIYFVIIMGLNTYTPDYENYEKMYEMGILNLSWNAEDLDFEWGYRGLNILFNLLGYSFQEFRLFFSILYATIAVSAAYRLSCYPNYALALFLIWPLLGGVSGLRMAIASVIVCWGIPLLLKSGWKGVVQYLLVLLIAISFHISTIFYAIFVLARREFTQKQLRFLFVTAIGGFFLLYSSSFIGQFTSTLNNPKFERWLNISSNDEGVSHMNALGILMCSFQVLFILMVVKKQTEEMIASINRNKCVTKINKKKYIEKYTLYRNIFLLLVLSMPGYVISSEYQRFLHGVLLVGYSVFSEFSKINYNVLPQKKHQLVVLAFASALFMLILYIYSMKSHNIFDTLTNNMFFNG